MQRRPSSAHFWPGWKLRDEREKLLQLIQQTQRERTNTAQRGATLAQIRPKREREDIIRTMGQSEQIKLESHSANGLLTRCVVKQIMFVHVRTEQTKMFLV